MWLEDYLQNRKNHRKTFAKPGYGDFPAIEIMQFIPGRTSLRSGIEPDIMTEMKGPEAFSFEECAAIALRADLNGIVVPFFPLIILFKIKKRLTAHGQVDVIYPEKIKRFLRNKQGKTTRHHINHKLYFLVSISFHYLAAYAYICAKFQGRI